MSNQNYRQGNTGISFLSQTFRVKQLYLSIWKLWFSDIFRYCNEKSFIITKVRYNIVSSSLYIEIGFINVENIKGESYHNFVFNCLTIFVVKLECLSHMNTSVQCAMAKLCSKKMEQLCLNEKKYDSWVECVFNKIQPGPWGFTDTSLRNPD